MDTTHVVESIVDDVIRNHRSFLPGGPPPDEQGLRANLRGGVQFDGLNFEERALLLSILPAGVTNLFVRPMDKGLSGAKVLATRFRVDHTWSKPFVTKIGPKNKLEREANAMRTYVAPFIGGIESPIYRVGADRAVLVQELRGLTPTTDPTSLRLHVRNTDGSDAAIRRLLEVRLAPWYERRGEQADISVADAFRWYLTKAPSDLNAAYPRDWRSLREWTTAETGTPAPRQGQLDELLSSRLRSKMVVIHGDLHAQNVLVDETSAECWPIDFGWCDSGHPAILDMVMLECSLKFLTIPMRADLRTLMHLEARLSAEAFPTLDIDDVPYAAEIRRSLEAVAAVRQHALGHLGIPFEDYRRGLAAMTFSLSGHTGLNVPYVLASLQILLASISGRWSIK